MALALDLMGDRLFRKELVEKGSMLGHVFEKCPKFSNMGQKSTEYGFDWLILAPTDSINMFKRVQGPKTNKNT